MKRKACFLVAFLMLAGTAGAELKLPVQALPDSELAMLRGGFVLDGLEIAIGLEQLVAVNGETLVVNRLNIPDLNQAMSSDRLTQQMQQMETVMNVQAAGAAGMSLTSAPVGNGGWMTVLQNSLDSTTIQHIRTLNIELNNLGGAYRFPRDSGLPLLP